LPLSNTIRTLMALLKGNPSYERVEGIPLFLSTQ